MRDDFTDDANSKRWCPEIGWHDLEIVTVKEGTSKAGNPKYTINFASADNPGNGLQQDLTNIPGKRWLLHQLVEACGIEPEENEEGRKIYNWETTDLEGKTISARIEHEPNDWTDRSGNVHNDKRAKIAEFKELAV